MASGFWEPEPEITSHAAVAEPQAPSRWQDEPPPAAVQAQIAPNRSVPMPDAQPRWEEALPPAPQAGRDVWSEMHVSPGPEITIIATSDPPHMSRSDNTRRGDEHDRTRRMSSFPRNPSILSTRSTLMTRWAAPLIEPVQHLPANLIEFPRESVATRKAPSAARRGPFYDASHHNSQLSIFEVDPDSLTATANSGEAARHEVAPPEWASIELDHHTHRHDSDRSHSYAEHSYVAATEIPAAHAHEMASTGVEEMPVESIPVLQAEARVAQSRISSRISPQAIESALAAELLVAPMSDRLLASVVDGALVTLAFLAASVVVIASTTHPPAGSIALIAGALWMAALRPALPVPLPQLCGRRHAGHALRAHRSLHL